ncbi:uncharacterized protein LOC122534799 [Frieseomelitta varia]|uniref:uncharacterized protein LOC122534799 n=1 Tax=Frieseomelitta varia TaxID=561572 RepID=UPI001CB6AC8D|nr:uncharacterized protein LOC122534799 [Frieseomelitta varia]
MFLQKQSYFSQLAKSYPILKLVDVYDRQSFVRAYVLDNVYVCVLMHVFFYVALWYATTVIRRMEKANKEMLKIMEENRTRLEDVVALKDKKGEYDEVVVKVQEAQKLTSQELEDEMRRLSTELINAEGKLSELERVVKKLIFSTCPARNRARVLRPTSLTEKTNTRGRRVLAKDRREPRPRISRYSSRHFHRPCHRNLHPGNMGSLSLDLLANVVHLPRLQLHLHPQKSDSSNYASVEASSESAIYYRSDKFLWSAGDGRRGSRKRRRKRHGKFSNGATSTRVNVKKLHEESLKNVTPFTKSLLGLITIFTQEKS